MATSMDDALKAQEKLQQELGGDEDVNGIGLGKNADGWFLKVNLAEPSDPDRTFPPTVDGVGVEYSIIGVITKQDG